MARRGRRRLVGEGAAGRRRPKRCRERRAVRRGCEGRFAARTEAGRRVRAGLEGQRHAAVACDALPRSAAAGSQSLRDRWVGELGCARRWGRSGFPEARRGREMERYDRLNRSQMRLHQRAFLRLLAISAVLALRSRAWPARVSVSVQARHQRVWPFSMM